MLRVVHPHGVSDPARIRSSHVEVRVRVRININLVFSLEPELVIIDTNMTELAGDYVDIGGAGRNGYDFHYSLSPKKKPFEGSCELLGYAFFIRTETVFKHIFNLVLN